MKSAAEGQLRSRTFGQPKVIAESKTGATVSQMAIESTLSLDIFSPPSLPGKVRVPTTNRPMSCDGEICRVQAGSGGFTNLGNGTSCGAGTKISSIDEGLSSINAVQRHGIS